MSLQKLQLVSFYESLPMAYGKYKKCIDRIKNGVEGGEGKKNSLILCKVPEIKVNM